MWGNPPTGGSAVTLLQDFKKFLMQGSLVALATAVVIGTVFAAVVKALIADIITPIIALIFGKPNFEDLSFTINSSHFLYGDFINAVFTFVVTAAAVFFLVAKPYNAFEAIRTSRSARSARRTSRRRPGAARTARPSWPPRSASRLRERPR
jgi:large conductance mechanosensitive channel